MQVYPPGGWHEMAQDGAASLVSGGIVILLSSILNRNKFSDALL